MSVLSVSQSSPMSSKPTDAAHRNRSAIASRKSAQTAKTNELPKRFRSMRMFFLTLRGTFAGTITATTLLEFDLVAALNTLDRGGNDLSKAPVLFRIKTTSMRGDRDRSRHHPRGQKPLNHIWYSFDQSQVFRRSGAFLKRVAVFGLMSDIDGDVVSKPSTFISPPKKSFRVTRNGPDVIIAMIKLGCTLNPRIAIQRRALIQMKRQLGNVGTIKWEAIESDVADIEADGNVTGYLDSVRDEKSRSCLQCNQSQRGLNRTVPQSQFLDYGATLLKPSRSNIEELRVAPCSEPALTSRKCLTRKCIALLSASSIFNSAASTISNTCTRR
jgi:hypothetical protein